MERKGFSIIELMVTVVILGVLSAVAVPKLFGLIDKSKASEVSPAAGAYIKLQEAYIHEHHKGGDWQSIGYKSPAGNATGKARTTTFEYDASQSTYNWTAETNLALNSCSKGSKWFINYNFDGNVNHIKFWASSDDITNCSGALTPNFKNLSTTTTAITSPGGTE